MIWSLPSCVTKGWQALYKKLKTIGMALDTYTLCMRISYAKTSPEWGHYRYSVCKPLEEVLRDALEVAQTDQDWLPWKVYSFKKKQEAWAARPMWNRQEIIEALENYIKILKNK